MPREADNQTSGVDDDAPETYSPSLREVAEAAWDEFDDSGSDDGGASRGDGRDAKGRFVSKEQTQEPGEAELDDEEAPSPDDEEHEETQDEPDPAVKSNQAPEHWSAEDKAVFAKAPQEVRDMYLRRYSEMEADYTRKSQANAGAVQFTQQLTPIFQDPDIARSMQAQGLQPLQAIADWARLHKAAVSGDGRVRAGVMVELAERMGFDPAKLFATSRTVDNSVPETLRNDPTFKYVANLTDRTTSDLQALRAEIQQFKQAETERIEQEALGVTRSSIDAFADEKGADGKPLRPYFDHVLPRIVEAFQVDNNRDLNDVYEQACWADPQIRQHMIQAEALRKQHVQSNRRATQAARSNVRGLTSPVSKPSADRKGNGSMRDVLENSADEVGF